MRVSEMLVAIANWLESPNNEALLLAEHDENSFKIAAEACLTASNILKYKAAEVDKVEPFETNLTEDSLDELADIANAFDESGDPNLIRTASVIDELLLTIAAPANAFNELKEAQEREIEEIAKRYQNPKKKLDEYYKAADTIKEIEKSPYFKTYRVMEHPLSTRTCPDHPGEQVQRVGDNAWQCSLDKKIYDYNVGFTDERGNKIPGGSVANQTQDSYPNEAAMFSSREDRLSR